MELIAALLLAGPLGYLVRPPKRALIAYLAVWAAILPVQTVIVLSAEDTFTDTVLYWVFNALILALGIGLNRLGARRAAGRRDRRRAGSPAAAPRWARRRRRAAAPDRAAG